MTGASGCLGSALVPRLLRADADVRALIRPARRETYRDPAGTRVFAGDMRDESYLASALGGASVVIHLAGLVHADERELTWDDFYAANVATTRVLYEASLRAGVRRFVFVSSILAVGDTEGSEAYLTEDTPCRPRTFYGKSKLLAEQILQDLARDGAPEVVIVRPSMIYGERDRGNFGRMLLAISRGRFLLPGDGRARKSVCYAGNAAHALALAASERPGRGGLYLLSDVPAPTVSELVGEIAWSLQDLTGRRARIRRAPMVLLNAAARLNGQARRLGAPEFVSAEQLRKLTTSVVLDTRRIRRELGYAPQLSLRDGVRRTVDWFLRHGPLR